METAVSAMLTKLGIQITTFSQFIMAVVLSGTHVITFENYMNVYLSY